MIQGLSLSELAQTVVRHASGKRDFVLPSQSISFDLGATAKDLLVNVGGESFGMNGTATDQAIDHLDIPRRYASRLHSQVPELLLENMNVLMARRPNTERRMVRTLESSARSFLSDGYRRIDNELVFDGLYPVFTRLGGQVESSNVSDDYLNLQVIFHRVEGQIRPGDVVRYGVHIQNSEVGKGALAIRPLIYRLVCTNGMISADHARRRTHVGGSYLETADDMSWVALSSETQTLKTRAIIAEMGEYLEALAAPARFEALVNNLREKADQVLPAEPQVVIESLAARYNLRENEKNSALMALAGGNDFTRWGLANSITAIANDASVYDRAVELETLGGVIMSLPAAGYSALGTLPKKSEVIDGELVHV
jgi:hypothetical protein